jgi:hypothetical protein
MTRVSAAYGKIVKSRRWSSGGIPAHSYLERGGQWRRWMRYQVDRLYPASVPYGRLEEHTSEHQEWGKARRGKKKRRKKKERNAYLSCGWVGATIVGLSTTAVSVGSGGPEVDEVATATSGNCCLKLARNSSPGLCELFLQRSTVSKRITTRCRHHAKRNDQQASTQALLHCAATTASGETCAGPNLTFDGTSRGRACWRCPETAALVDLQQYGKCLDSSCPNSLSLRCAEEIATSPCGAPAFLQVVIVVGKGWWC